MTSFLVCVFVVITLYYKKRSSYFLFFEITQVKLHYHGLPPPEKILKNPEKPALKSPAKNRENPAENKTGNRQPREPGQSGPSARKLMVSRPPVPSTPASGTPGFS